MPTYKLRAKQLLGGKLPKGTEFQVVVESGKELNAGKIRTAIKNQLGIDLPESSCYTSYFEKL